MVRVWGMEPSAIWGISMEGALLRYEPSTVSGLSADGSANIFAQQLRANTRERGYCHSWLWTGFADRAPGPGFNIHLKDAYGQKTEEAANRHYSGLQPQ